MSRPEIVKKFKQIVVKGFDYRKFDDEWVSATHLKLCHPDLHRMFQINKDDRLEVCLSSKPKCADSVPITLRCKEMNWEWCKTHQKTPKKKKLRGIIHYSIDMLLRKRFGGYDQIIYAWLTIY